MKQFIYPIHTFIILLLFLSLEGLAQNVTISGVITDAQTDELLPGVNVKIQESGKGVASDLDGRYQLEVPVSSTVEFSFVGYKNQQIVITKEGVYNIALEAGGIDLNPVVISANRQQQKLLDAPASITSIQPKTLENQVNTSPTDVLKDVAGVDVVKNGLQNSTVVIRGFNGAFSAATLTLVDNRIAGIASLRSNSYQMIPVTEDDIERIEVLRGPASALYGPNSASGVVHYITKSPIDHQGTKLSVGTGIRAFIQDTIGIVDSENPLFDNKDMFDRMVTVGQVRHAAKLKLKNNDNVQMGYKFSAKYFQGDDWKYDDPFEEDSIIKIRQTANGIVPLYADGSEVPADMIADGETGDYVDNRRTGEAQKYSIDSRFDVRIGDDTELIFNAGLNSATNVELTPIGAGYLDDWKYWYAQARLRYKKLFVQTFVNANHSGDSYNLRGGDVLVDRSKLWVAQVQHSAQPIKKLNLIYGADALWTRPDSDYTIMGAFEDRDNINEYGAYVQGDYKILPKLSLLAAARVDYHSVINKPFFSPRAALVYKPKPNHTVRATFNRSFTTPATNTLFLDVSQGALPTGINIRAIGNVDGFNYNFAENPNFGNANLPQFTSPYGDGPTQYYNVGDQSINNTAWSGIIDFLKEQFLLETPDEFVGILESVLNTIIPNSIEDISHEVKDLNLTTNSFTNSDWQNIQNINGLQNIETITYELGYKGIVGKNLFVTVDAYRSDIKNLLGPTLLISPAVMLNSEELIDYVGPIIQQNLEDNDALAGILVDLIDTSEEAGGNNNGRVDDEFISIITEAVANLPIGSITPTSLDSPTMVLASTNIGDVTVYGVDLSANLYLSEKLKISSTYSYVDKDSIAVPGAQFGYVALNAPRHKASIGLNYDVDKYGVNLGSRFRWYDSFPINSGSFVGRVPAHHELDVNL